MRSDAQDGPAAADTGEQVVTERLAHPYSIDLLPDDPAPPPFEAAPETAAGPAGGPPDAFGRKTVTGDALRPPVLDQGVGDHVRRPGHTVRLRTRRRDRPSRASATRARATSSATPVGANTTRSSIWRSSAACPTGGCSCGPSSGTASTATYRCGRARSRRWCFRRSSRRGRTTRACPTSPTFSSRSPCRRTGSCSVARRTCSAPSTKTSSPAATAPISSSTRR